MKINFQTRLLSSLTKVFGEESLPDTEFKNGSALLGEVYSFQLAYYSDRMIKDIGVSIDSPLKDIVQIRAVELAPCNVASNLFDDNFLKKSAGMYPDILNDFEKTQVVPCQWRSLWITVNIPSSYKAEIYKIKISLNFELPEGPVTKSEEFALEIINAALPEQILKHTEWFHSDCIATRYNAEVWSEKYWTLVEKFVKNASEHGINMILTPLFTPPLDTKVDGERLTVQLVDIEKKADKYSFEFSRLTRWIDMLFRNNIKYIEFSHLFTQWGAGHAPKIIARENGVEKKIFGWETDAAGDDYKNFLAQFLPALRRFIRENKLESICVFHISDEPGVQHMESYRKALEAAAPHLEGMTIMDALSSIDFYDSGLVKNPVPSNNHIEPFRERKIKDLWTYYCCSQAIKVPNRFFAMPSERNRILGMLLYDYEIGGFLHWGYNFWYSQYSIKEINPYEITDAGKAFPSGDAFLVYPGENGPVDSIRHEVMREGLQDLRALKLLESMIGREKTSKLLKEDVNGRFAMDNYPRGKEWLLNKRERINQAIKKTLA
ncbi:MAG: hypothetical protein A2020_00110 [Lentisphaerae bacterium GWF2_45_14]|nr:MAG: hypothetical protein A2020_00110 [Lentisphaerae bacterium GWF2_45_14]